MPAKQNIQSFVVNVTTNSSGAATATSDRALSGHIEDIIWTKPASGGITGATLTVSTASTGQTIWSKSSVSASAQVSPRKPLHDSSGSALLYAAGGTPQVDKFCIAGEKLNFNVASGGNTLNGSFTVIMSS
jgi:hypothetical protein